MSGSEPLLTVTRAHVRLLALIAVLLVVIGFAIGLNVVSIREVTSQAIGGLFGVVGALALGARR